MSTDSGVTTKMQAAYSSIRRDIESGVFPPGMHLRVGTLQVRLGFSPTPIREAMRMLQSDGIITNHPHQGMTVTSHEPEELEEVYRLRELIEPLAAEYAARNRTQGDVERLTTLHEEIVKAVRDDRDSLAANLNAQFHAAIIEMSSSRLIGDVYSRLRIVLPLEALWLNSRSSLTVREHKKVVAAIAKGDPEAAGTAMRAHVERGHRQAAKRFATKLDGARR